MKHGTSPQLSSMSKPGDDTGGDATRARECTVTGIEMGDSDGYSAPRALPGFQLSVADRRGDKAADMHIKTAVRFLCVLQSP